MNFALDNFTDTTFWGKIEPKIEKQFGSKHPCQWNIETIDPEPRVNFKEGELTIELTFQNDLKCMSDKSPTEYTQLVTLFNKLTLDFNFAIEDNITFFFYVNNIDFQIFSYKDSVVGDIPIETWSDTIGYFEFIIIEAIDAYLPVNGTNIEELLNVHNLGIEKSEINLHNKYAELKLSPKFVDSPPKFAVKLLDEVKSGLGQVGAMLQNVFKDPASFDSEVEKLDDSVIDVINTFMVSKTVHYTLHPFLRMVPKMQRLLEVQFGADRLI